MILRDYQQTAVSKALSEKDNTIVACPTGSGKTAIIGGICQRLVSENSLVKILIVSHIQEIIKQDFEALVLFVDPDILGIYSAGIGYRHIEQITVAGIQSIYNKGFFDDYDYMLVDEAHLIPISGDGMYRTLFDKFEGSVIGFTATPYRLGKGFIFGDGKLFKNMCIDLTSKDKFNKLVSDGYLSKIFAYSPNESLDLSGVGTVAGDFSLRDMSKKFDRDFVTKKCLDEVIKVSEKYNKMLLFCIDIEHSENVSDMLNKLGIKTKAVHSKMKDRDIIIEELRENKIKAITNVDVLTTGFDDPEIDLIVLLRPTKSPVVHVQTIGRGLRVSDNKDHCLVMDFSGNTQRLGPINDIVPYVAKKGSGGEPITKTCPECRTIQHPSVRICIRCGHKFEFKVGISVSNSGCEIVSKGDTEYNVSSVAYNIHKKTGRPSSIRVTYQTGIIGLSFSQWICVEHKGYAKRLANTWLKNRGVEDRIDTVQAFIFASKRLKRARAIRVKNTGKYPEIVGVDLF